MGISDQGIDNAAIIIAFGLVMNGCMQMGSSSSITESQIVDERIIADAMTEAACMSSGGIEIEFGKCVRPKVEPPND